MKIKSIKYYITIILTIIGFTFFQGGIFGENIQIDNDENYIYNISDSAIISKKYIDNQDEGSENFVPGEVIVKYKDATILGFKVYSNDDVSIKKLEKSISKNNLEIQETIEEDNLAVLGIQDEKTVQETIDVLQDNSRIEYVQPNYIYSINQIEGEEDSVIYDQEDPDKNKLRGLENMSRYDAYNIFSGTDDTSITGVVVGVIDVGVNPVHPDLINQMRDGSGCTDDQGYEIGYCDHGFDFGLNNQYRSYPIFSYHGTHVAGTIAATIDNGTGIIGVNPKAKISSLKIDGPQGNLTTTTAIKAINFAKYNGIKIVNASRGGNIYDTGLYNAIKSYGESGGLVIAAAGNEHSNNDTTTGNVYPCNFDLDNILCIAAIDSAGNLARYSNFGDTSVDIAAPGSHIYSTIFNTGRWFITGFNNQYLTNSHSFMTNTIYLPQDRHYNLSFDQQCKYPGSGFLLKIYNGEDLIFSGHSPRDFNESVILSTKFTFTLINNIQIESGLKFSFELLGYNQDDAYCMISNIDIEKAEIFPSDLSGELYGYDDGTSMAAPHVAGLASLAWSFRPDLTYSDIIQAIIENGDYLESLNGKLVNPKKINAYQTLFSLDNFPPGAPELLSPASGQIYSLDVLDDSGINFVRSESADKGVGINGYSVQISNDQDFELFKNYTTEETGLYISTGDIDTGKYFWKVQSFDKNGNYSDYSEIYSFTIGEESSQTGETDTTNSGDNSLGNNSIEADTGSTNSVESNTGSTNSVESNTGSTATGEINTGDTNTGNINSGDNNTQEDTSTTGSDSSSSESNGGGASQGGENQNNNETQKSQDSKKTDNTDNESKEETQHHYSIFDYRYIAASPKAIQANGYTTEFNNAYRFALLNGITTKESIDQADMGGALTRIAMAKMLSNYAINVLGKDLDKSKTCSFSDINSTLNEKYDLGASKACQLGIMGVGIKNFRPYDSVTRAEFATALSRLLYNTDDGIVNYYSTHIKKLNDEKIISNINPNLQETRGYVMLMLMRSAIND